MSVSVAAVMRQCNNYFERSYKDGTFRIADNALEGIDHGNLPGFVCITGSAHHDGVWQMLSGCLTGHPVEGLPDETFEGRVWLLAPPTDFLELCKVISDYDEKNPTGAFQSESFGGYSYTRAANAASPWQVSFAGKLTPYRKMYTEVG